VKQVLNAITEGVFDRTQKLGQLQREMQLGLALSGYELGMATCVTAAANQLFLFARNGGEELSDTSAVYRILNRSSSESE